jgi:hypothetical protein
MSTPDATGRRRPSKRPPDDGSWTSPSGTPFAVPVSRDRRLLITAVALLAGPVVWSVHFLLVYLVAEAGCTGDGQGLRLFDPPVPTVVTLTATAVAAAAALASAAWAYRRWRAGRSARAAGEADERADGPDGEEERPREFDDHDLGGSLALAGCMLSLLAFVMVLFVGLPAAVLPSC